jgi:hypothetical protein
VRQVCYLEPRLCDSHIHLCPPESRLSADIAASQGEVVHQNTTIPRRVLAELASRSLFVMPWTALHPGSSVSCDG